MKIIFIILLLKIGLVAKPKTTITSYILKIISLNTDTSKRLFDTKLLFQKADRQTNSILEISTTTSSIGNNYMIVSDTLLKKKKERKGLCNNSNISYALVKSESVDSLKLLIYNLEKRIFTNEDLNSIVFYHFMLDTNFTMSFEFLNKQDLYYHVTNRDLEIDKGTNVYVPTLIEVIVYYRNRKHILKFTQFKKIFGSYAAPE